MQPARFIEDGYAVIPGASLIWRSVSRTLRVVQRAFSEMPTDTYSQGRRERAYASFRWKRSRGTIKRDATAAVYSQPASFNQADGGKSRVFDQIPVGVSECAAFEEILAADAKLVEQLGVFERNHLRVQVHFVRYRARAGAPAWSSPPWLHQDNEDVVFVHLIHLDAAAIGGDNIITDGPASPNVTYRDVVRLAQPLDTLVLTNKAWHAVTPSASGTAPRRRSATSCWSPSVRRGDPAWLAIFGSQGSRLRAGCRHGDVLSSHFSYKEARWTGEMSPMPRPR